MNWHADDIVNLIGVLAWPIVLIFIVWKFNSAIKAGLLNFFHKNSIKEFSIGTSGITAKMEASKQVSETEKDKKVNETLPAGMDAASIRKLHTERSTSYTIMLCEQIKNHIGLLDLNEAEKIDLLATEASILQANLNYIEITTLIFASQYDLFNKYMYPNAELSFSDIDAYFQEIKTAVENAYDDWDTTKYLAYPISISMIEQNDDFYHLTDLGRSYIMHVRNNPNHLKYMAQL